MDDGSTKDNTLEIAKKYEEQYPGIVKAVHQENGGHGQAVNTGLANATGVFFKVVDSDDWVDIKSYRKILTKLKEFVEKDDLPDMVIANYVYEKVGAKRKKLFIMRMHSQLRDDADRSEAILDRIPAGRWGTPEDMEGAVVYLASKASDYVNGFTLAVDGGWLAR